MLIMAVSGAAVLALVCWAALRERAPEHVIPQTSPDRHVDEGEGERQRAGGWGQEQGEGERQRAGGWGSEGEGERQRAGGWGSDGSDGDADAVPSRPLAGAVTTDADGLHNTTFADADTDQALAAAAALWNVMTEDPE
jgi:hypothetical protein